MRKFRYHVMLILVALLITGAVQPRPASAAQGYRWWAADEVKKELNLTTTQTEEIETIFKSLRPKFRELIQALEEEEEELADLMRAMQSEEWEIALQIDKVESARSALSKTRTLMLYRMRKILTTTQLDGLHDLWERRRFKGNPRTRHWQ
tara:strand:- start:920 stop:1369 length:450 start_codon:yes stop_codon:yes gene_type:complete